MFRVWMALIFILVELGRSYMTVFGEVSDMERKGLDM